MAIPIGSTDVQGWSFAKNIGASEPAPQPKRAPRSIPTSDISVTRNTIPRNVVVGGKAGEFDMGTRRQMDNHNWCGPG
jgi:hypothetical protein